MTSQAVPLPRDDSTGAPPAPGSRTASLAVRAIPAASPEARHWAAAELVRLGVSSADVRDDALLVVSELVSNAVQHGAGPVVVTLLHGAAGLTVSVADGGHPPYTFGSLPADPTASHGRGLAIVATVAAAWGIRAQRPGPGKSVWCRFPGDTPDAHDGAA